MRVTWRGMKIAPQAKLNDGNFDVVSIGISARPNPHQRPEALAGAHLGWKKLRTPWRKRSRAPADMEEERFCSSWTASFRSSAGDISNRPGALRVRCPA